MALESAEYISELVTTNPTGSDPKSRGDDHIRMLKEVLKRAFAGYEGFVGVFGTEAQGATVNDYIVTTGKSIADYTTGMRVTFLSTHQNTSACTIKIDDLSSKQLVDVDGIALSSTTILSGSLVEAIFDGTKFLLISANNRASIDGDTYRGNHNFTGATLRAPTLSVGENSTKVATTAFVVASAFSSSLPAQTGNAGKFITTDGTTASWEDVLPDEANNAGKELFTDGSSPHWGVGTASALYLSSNFF